MRDTISDALLESIEAGDWYGSISQCDQLGETLYFGASHERVIDGLMDCTLQEVRRLAAEPKHELHVDELESQKVLVDFLLEHEAEDNLPTEFAVVRGRVEHLLAIRTAERKKRVQAEQTQQGLRNSSNAARDHALVTELMRNLDGPP